MHNIILGSPHVRECIALQTVSVRLKSNQGRYFLLALRIVRKYPFLFHRNDTRINRRFRKMEPCCLLLDGDVRVVLSLVCGPHYGRRGKSRFSFYFPIMTFAFVLLLGYIFSCGGSQEHLLGPLMKSLKVDASVGWITFHEKVSLLQFLLHFSH